MKKKALCIICMILISVSLLAIPSSAKRGRIGDLTWNLDGTHLTLSGEGSTGEVWKSPWGTDITEVTVEEGVTELGNFVFTECKKLKTVTLPSTLKAIGDQAFFNCFSLTDVYIPDNVTVIGREAFISCENLRSVHLPQSLIALGEAAFIHCYKLEDITLDASCKRFKLVDDVLFSKDGTVLYLYPAKRPGSSYEIPDTVTKIVDYAMCNATQISYLTIPDSVTEVGKAAFSNTKVAKNAKYENGIKYIGDIAIDAETSIKTTEIKKGTRVIASSTFVNSTNLTSVVIPEGVTHIGDLNFKYSKRIEYVVLPKSLKSIGKECFDESTKITAVYYAGSEADKRDMTVQSSKLRSKTWYYNACLGKAEHTWDGGKTVSAATCTEKGSILYTCTVCGATGKGETKALGHSLGSWKTVTATTCLADGYEKKSCSRCNYYETRTVSALGHVYGAITVSLEPTCTASGSESQACTRCGSTVTRSIPAKGHTFGTWEVTVEPTCTDEGTETKTCASCNATEERSVPAKGHSFGAWAHATDPTCTEWGTEKRSCSTCLTVETNEYRDPLGHSFGQKVITKEPNLWENGSASITCSVCDYTEETSVPCFASNEDGSITIEADEGVFGKDTVFGTTQLKWYHSGKGLAKEALKDISGKFITYEITTTVGEEEVRPNGVVTLSVAIPEGYGEAKLYRINGDGTATLLQTMIHNGMAVTEISETGLIVICQPGEYESSVNPVLIALCAVLTLALAVSSAVLIKALKKK